MSEHELFQTILKIQKKRLKIIITPTGVTMLAWLPERSVCRGFALFYRKSYLLYQAKLLIVVAIFSEI